MRSLSRLCVGLSFALLCVAQTTVAQPAPTVQWRQIEAGLDVGRYEVTSRASVLKSQVVLLRVDPARFAFRSVYAPDLGAQRTDVRSMAERIGGLAAINANYFDPNGNALGVVVASGVLKQKVHEGGRALTGVFQQRFDGTVQIVHRGEFDKAGVSVAVQAGPRLVVAGKSVAMESMQGSSRRSGIALTRDRRVIVFATLLRFPGATFEEIQRMLLLPELGIVEALNFDGGGSSQLYVARGESSDEDLFVGGGDLVPVGLVVVRKAR